MSGLKKPKGAVKCKMVPTKVGDKKVKRCWDKNGKFVSAKTGKSKKK